MTVTGRGVDQSFLLEKTSDALVKCDQTFSALHHPGFIGCSRGPKEGEVESGELSVLVYNNGVVRNIKHGETGLCT